MPSNPVLKFFAKYIEQELGIVYSEHNFFQLQNRLEEIAKLVGVPSVAALYEAATKEISGPFKQLLLDVATNNETSFFRDIKVFRAIENLVLSEAAKLKAGEEFQVWSAAASTGQEALSLAMLVQEYNFRQKTNIRMKLTATDISERALLKCKAGVYTQLEVQRGLPAPYLIKYFKKSDPETWAASPEILDCMTFEKLNLRKDFYFPQKFHLILCRNVLIYQSVENKKAIVRRLCKALVPGGYMVLGAGESLLGISTEFQQCTMDGALLYQKPLSAVRAA